MDKKTLSNLELEITQKIQLHFPRGVIPLDILKFWSNCNSDILATILLEAFYTLDSKSSILKVRRSIPLKLPHNEKLDASFYFTQDDSEYQETFDVNNVISWFPEKLGHSVHTKDLFLFIEENNLIHKQLDMYHLWAIYLRGKDFFLEHFSGIVYALKSVVKSNGDLYVPGITINTGDFRLNWYSGWNNFSRPDNFLAFKKKE